MLNWCAQQSKTYCADRLKIMRAGLVSISSVAGGWVFIPHPCVYAGHLSSDPKESFARRVIMRPGKEQARLGSKLFMVRRAFKRDVLRIQPSDRHEILREHTRHIRESFPRSSGDPTSRIRSLTEEYTWGTPSCRGRGCEALSSRSHGTVAHGKMKQKSSKLTT